MTKKLIVYYGDSPVCVEGFSSTAKRSVEGSIHLLPRKSLSVTQDEHEHIKKAYPEIASKLKVVAETKTEDKQAEKQPAQEEQQEVAGDESATPSSKSAVQPEGTPGKSSKKK